MRCGECRLISLPRPGIVWFGSRPPHTRGPGVTMLGRLSLALKYLLPVMTVVAVTVVALVLFSSGQFHTQQEVMASDAAEASLRLLTESLEFSMAQGARDFEPLLSRLPASGRIRGVRLVATPELGVSRKQ